MGFRHSSVDPFASTICCPRFESQAHHLSIIILNQICAILSCEKNENKQKEAGLAHLKKTSRNFFVTHETSHTGSGDVIGPENAFGFSEFFSSLRNNATKLEIAKNFLTALATLNEKSDVGPKFVLWTLPTILFALLGLVYFIGKMKQNQTRGYFCFTIYVYLWFDVTTWCIVRKSIIALIIPRCHRHIGL